EGLAGADQVRIVELVPVGVENLLPVVGTAVELLRDGRQAVALFHGVDPLADAARGGVRGSGDPVEVVPGLGVDLPGGTSGVGGSPGKVRLAAGPLVPVLAGLQPEVARIFGGGAHAGLLPSGLAQGSHGAG